MNNLERYQERVVELESEIVEYRMILESIRMVARQAPKDIPREPLFNLASKALTQQAGAEIQAEFLTLRMLEAGMRQELLTATKRPDDDGKTFTLEDLKMWQEAMTAIVQGNNELLVKLDEIRARTRQREASRLILPT